MASLRQPGDEYRCALCGGIFITGWSEAQAAAEYAANFPAESATGDKKSDLCSVCFEEFMAWWRTQRSFREEHG